MINNDFYLSRSGLKNRQKKSQHPSWLVKNTGSNVSNVVPSAENLLPLKDNTDDNLYH